MEAEAAIYEYAAMPKAERSKDEITARLILLRRAVAGDSHGSQVAFCNMTGLATNAWGNLEAGRNRISVDTAIVLSRTLGVSLDWIYQGPAYERFLPGDLIEKIRAARDNEPLEPTKRKSRLAAQSG